MAVVVDASAIGAIAFGEPEGPTLAAHLTDQTLIAPALIDYELANLALKKVRRRSAPAAKVLISLRAALALPISRVQVPMLEAFALAERTGVSSHDASYLWLARSQNVELVTLDVKLAKLCVDY